MPNQTSLGFEAICDTLHCNHLYSTTDIVAGDITCDTLQVSGISTTTGIINTGTITTDNLTATNINRLEVVAAAVVPNLILESNYFSSIYNNYRINLTFKGIGSNPTNAASIFLYLKKTTASDVNQFVYTSSFLEGSSSTTTNDAYYPFRVGWLTSTPGYREEGEWDYVIDILNPVELGRACEIRSYNLSNSNNLDPAASSVGGPLGNLICNGYSYGNGAPSLIGTQLSGPYAGFTIHLGPYFLSAGDVKMSVCGYN